MVKLCLPQGLCDLYIHVSYNLIPPIIDFFLSTWCDFYIYFKPLSFFLSLHSYFWLMRNVLKNFRNCCHGDHSILKGFSKGNQGIKFNLQGLQTSIRVNITDPVE